MQAGCFQSVESGLDLERAKGVEGELEIGSHLLSFPRSAGHCFFCLLLSILWNCLQFTMRHNPCTVFKETFMLVFNFLESFLDIIVLVGEKWGGGQWWGRYTSINFLDSAGVLLVVH